MKKILLGIAVFITTAILCIVSAGAETYGDYEYTVLGDGTVEITEYIGDDTEVEIPSEIDGKAVTKIGYRAFADCTSLTSITIPDSVTTIYLSAFSNCSSLTSVTIPDSITSINQWVFECCSSLTSITIPDSVTIIYAEAFSGCTSLKSITLPESLDLIGPRVFLECESLTSITIPKNVTAIGANVFTGCSSLESINVDPANEYYTSVDGVLFDNHYEKTTLKTYPEGKKSTNYTVPEGVTDIGWEAFARSSTLASITIPDSVTSIGGCAFWDCTFLTSVNIPDNVTRILYSTFDGCSSLKSVNIPDSVTSIAFDAFYDCTSLTSVTIPDSVTSIGEDVFYNCTSLTSVTIPDSVTSIGDYAFGYFIDSDRNRVKVDGFTISCYENSAAHTYAVNNEFDYKLITVSTPTAMKGFKLGGRANNALRLNWTKNDTADGYIIEQYNGSKWVRVAKITSNATTTYKISGLKAGTAYKFRMRAYKMDGTKALYSAYTSTLSARTNPSNVSGFKLGGRAADALRLNWTKNTSADGYIIEQYKSGEWVRIAKITSNATTTYKISGLKASTQYKFRVKAYKMSGKTALYSGYTSTLSAYTSPSNVANLKITGKATTALRLGWSKNTSADGYIIEMYKDGKWVRAAKITSNATVTFRKAGLKKGTTYKFRVRTYNMVGKTVLYGNYVNISGTTK